MSQFLHAKVKGNNLVDGLVRPGTDCDWSDILTFITHEYRNTMSHVSLDKYLAPHNRRVID